MDIHIHGKPGTSDGPVASTELPPGPKPMINMHEVNNTTQTIHVSYLADHLYENINIMIKLVKQTECVLKHLSRVRCTNVTQNLMNAQVQIVKLQIIPNTYHHIHQSVFGH